MNTIINKHPIKLDKLEELINNIENLINEYNIQYLLNIFYEFKDRLEKERLNKEKLEKDRLEKERLNKERLNKEKLEKEKLEKDILNKNYIIDNSLYIICASCKTNVSRYNTWNREKQCFYCNNCHESLY